MLTLSKRLGLSLLLCFGVARLYCSTALAQLEIIAITGDAAPDANGTFNGFGVPVLNATGQTAFSGFLTGTTGGSSDDGGVYLGGVTGGVTQISRDGAAAPDSNGTFNSQFRPELNAAGQTAFNGYLTGTTGGASDDGGVFLGGATGGVAQIVRERDAVPDGNGTYISLGSPVLNAAGQTAFTGNLTGTTGGNSDNSGIFLGGPSGGATQIVREGAVPPDLNGTFRSFASPALNASGQTAFSGSLTGSTGGGANGVFLRGATGGVTQIVRSGDAAPDANGTLSGFETPALNASGQTVFRAYLAGTTGSTTDDRGVYLGAATGGVTQIVREGDVAPDSDGSFDTLGNPALNSAGQVAFTGSLTGTIGGGNEYGLFISAYGRLLQVARTGDAFDGSLITGMSFQSFPIKGVGFNDAGQVAYQLSLADGRRAIMRNTIVVDPNWDNAGSGDWDTGVNWVGGIAPHAFHETSINPSSSLTVTGPTNPRTVHSLELGTLPGGQAELVLQNELAATTGITIGGLGKLTLSGQTVAGVAVDTGAKIGGFGMVVGAASFVDALIEPTGSSFVRSGPLDFGADYAAVASFGFADLGSHTTIGGGTLSIPAGLFIQGASSLEGEGVVDGKIAAAFGSTIRATGPTLLLGDANAFAGFHSDGELYTGANTVEIYDRNEAVLGSLTQLGDGAQAGALIAGSASAGDAHSHFLVEQGKNLVGRGNVAGHRKNHGNVIGDGTAAGERIVFDLGWTVTGKGSFVNTSYLGTFSPGESPGVVDGANLLFGGSVALELGGLTPGAGADRHDQINDAGELVVGDQASVMLASWNQFVPAVGDELVLMTWAGGLEGTFSNVLIDPWFWQNGVGFELRYDESAAGGALVARAAKSADFNGAGAIDGADLGDDSAHLSGGDFLTWQRQFGQSAGAAPTLAAVPEPSSVGLMLLSTIAYWVIGRRSERQARSTFYIGAMDRIRNDFHRNRAMAFRRFRRPGLAVSHVALLLTGAATARGDFVVFENEVLNGALLIEENVVNQGAAIGSGPNERLVFAEGYALTGAGSLEYTLSLGTYSPGNSPAVVTGTNQQFGGVVEVELGGTTPGFAANNHDQINDTAILELLLSSTLSVLSFNSYVPSIGDTFTVLTWQTSLVGSFGSIEFDPFFANNGITFLVDVINAGGAGSLSLTAVPEPSALLYGGLITALAGCKRWVTQRVDSAVV